MTQRRIRADGRPYSTAVVADGGLIFISGQIPVRDGAIVTGTMAEQTAVVFANLQSALATVGAGLADVVRCGVFLADLSALPEFNEVYVRAFGTGELPTRTTVGALLPGYAVEIDAIAVAPQA